MLCVDVVIPQAVIIRCRLAGITDRAHNVHLSQMQAKVIMVSHSVSLRVESYIRRYHVYQRIWNPKLGEVAVAVREGENFHDHYAVAILEEDTCCTVEHMPRKISKERFFLLKTGGAIIASKVTNRRAGSRYRAC